MALLTTVLDALGLVTAAAAAWFWYLSGTRRLRRVSRFEDLYNGHLDLAAFSRASILKPQAAKAAAASAAALALRFAARV